MKRIVLAFLLIMFMTAGANAGVLRASYKVGKAAGKHVVVPVVKNVAKFAFKVVY
jgi:hypothetical protein